MKIVDIYKKYEISQILQLHQLKVAAVASLICDNFAQVQDKNTIITACLIHDMGNVLKFNFEYFSDEFFEPEGKIYWKQVKEKFRQKYGDDEHKASIQIAKELSVSNRVIEIISRMEFDMLAEIANETDFEIKICKYSDLRVSPLGVTSLKDRLSEGKKRYVEQPTSKYLLADFERLASYAQKVEQQIFEKCRIKPEDINDDSVSPPIEDLKNFEINSVIK